MILHPMRGLPALALCLALLLAGCIHTPPFVDERGQPVPGSIAAMETVTIGGVPQSVWLRGLATDNPALILLHGGPGTSESALFRHYDAGLERDFLVVYWDQRGTGRSFRSDLDPKSMTIDRMLSDLDELVELVRHRFDKQKVVLLGHSWGTVLGTLYSVRHPDKVALYIGVAQIADMVQGEALSHGFALEQAIARQDDNARRKLEAMGDPPYTVDHTLELGRIVEQFGGVFHGDMATGTLIAAALAESETNLYDLVLFGRGNRFSLDALWPDLRRLELRRCCSRLAVPVVFFLGRYDEHVPSSLAADWFQHLDAPQKRLVWFEASAHNPPFEEPAAFQSTVRSAVTDLARW